MTDHIPDTSKKVEQSPLRDLAGEWLTVSKDLEADHRHIWHAFHHLASAIAAEVERIDAEISEIDDLLGTPPGVVVASFNAG